MPNTWGLYAMYSNAWEWVFNGIIMPYCRATGPAVDKIYRVTGAANGCAGLFM